MKRLLLLIFASVLSWSAVRAVAADRPPMIRFAQLHLPMAQAPNPKTNPACILKNYSPDELSPNEPQYYLFDSLFVRQANEVEDAIDHHQLKWHIHPALLKALAQSESSLNPHGLLFSFPSGGPEEQTRKAVDMLEGYLSNPDTNELIQIKVGKTMRTLSMKEVLVQGIFGQLSAMNKTDPAKAWMLYNVRLGRFLVGIFNAGLPRTEKALGKYILNHNALPLEFMQMWQEYQAEAGNKFLETKRQLYKITRLCGDQPEGYLGEYWNDFPYDPKTRVFSEKKH